MNILPDSRLARPIATRMMDWEMPDGTFLRVEVERVYCVDCGTPGPYVPCGNTASVAYFCLPCSEKYGAAAAAALMPDDVFNQKLTEEMLESHGRILTADEVVALEQQGKLGRGLELLARESPYKA